MKDWTPIDPICPSFCRFNRICSKPRQRGINPLFIEDRYERRATACFYFEGMNNSLKRRFGIETDGLNAEEVADLVVERLGMEGN